MKAIFFLLAATLCAIFPLFAQSTAIQWQNTIGCWGHNNLTSLQQTANGGYILGGYSDCNSSGDKTENNLGVEDFWVVKLNATGAIEWQNTIGGNSWDRLNALQETADGGYILGGESVSNISDDKTENSNGGYDYWVVKLDTTGAIQWQNTIGGNQTDKLTCLQETADGGYILGGRSNSNISGDKTENSLGGDWDYWVVKLDAIGTIQWQNTIGGNGDDELYSILQTTDGGYILGGSSNSNISGDKSENSNGGDDYWVIKLYATGVIQWQNTIGGNGSDRLSSPQQTVDGGFILAGSSNSTISGDKSENSHGDDDFWVVKLGATGVIQWQKTIGGSNSDYISSMQKTADGGCILGGFSQSSISGDKTENSNGDYDYWVVKLDSTGGIQWQNTIGGSDIDYLAFSQQTVDGGYILAGSSASSISGDKTEDSHFNFDYWVVKLAPETVPTGEASTAQASITIFPNPTNGAVFVRADTETTLRLCNATGQSILTQTIHGNGKIDLSSWPNGIYVLVEMETGIGHKILKKN